LVRLENKRQDKPLNTPFQADDGESGMEPDFSLPRQGKLRRILGRTPVIMTVAIMLLSAVAALSFYATHWKRKVTVTRLVVNGTTLIPSGSIEKRLEGFKGMNLEEVRLDDIHRALRSEPYIRNMQIGRELNGILRVRIEERKPAAALVDGNDLMIIDTEGFILPDNEVSARFRRLLPVYGAGRLDTPDDQGLRRLNTPDRQLLFELLAAFVASEHVGMMVSEIHLSKENQTWFAVKGSSIRFVVGNDGDFKEKLKKFEIFWQKVVAKKGIDCYESVDLRFRDKVFASEPEPEGNPALPATPETQQNPDEHH
jgi:cell division protein FtsQ